MSNPGEERQSGTSAEAITIRDLPSNPFARWPVRLAIHAVAAIALLVSVVLAISEGSFTPAILGLVVLAAAEGVWLYFHVRR